MISTKTNNKKEQVRCNVKLVFAGGTGLQDAYRIMAKIAIERMEDEKNAKGSNISTRQH